MSPSSPVADVPTRDHHLPQQRHGGERPRHLVAIPTYNELENLESIVTRTLAAREDLEVLVVDDNSPDGTGALADEIASRSGRVHVLHRAGKEGLGAAYLAAFAWALDHDFATVCEMDADGSHRPEQLQRLYAAIDGADGFAGADLVLGSRWVPGGGVQNWPKHREVLSRGGNWYVRRALKLPLADATGGFRVFRASTLRALDLQRVESQGYCFQVDLARRAVRAGLVVREVPIDFLERELGDSKMTGSIVREALWRVTVWGLRDRARRSPRGSHRPPAATTTSTTTSSRSDAAAPRPSAHAGV